MGNTEGENIVTPTAPKHLTENTKEQHEDENKKQPPPKKK